MTNLAYRVAFTSIPGIGRARLQALETFFGGLEASWQAGAAGLTQAGLDKRTVQAAVARRPGQRLPPRDPAPGRALPPAERIMSGMALGTLVVEADKGSGALITANQALEQNREVLAVPGSILSPASRGTNQLIQAGAKAVLTVEDVLEELNMTAVAQPAEPAQPSLDITLEEARLLDHLTREPVHIDELCQMTGLPMPALNSALALLELSGLARQVGAMHFVLGREAQAEYKVGMN